ncbi:hypothetical protein BT96DRAFT_947626 [Gymnopus androsaceus JB14]|uniref:Peptidase C14 caspase domain-containing protein n=1 Tax=Gymnopus androsaceus JB14 TaxID=1447944 RepID=A0A6A4GSM2_9AGAR|nr:hypothetical protein BT96DRAFT_947626 [Gymnopus androsaceus JB14]
MLSGLLANLALNKSDNITIILDCCHSGSGMQKSMDLIFQNPTAFLLNEYSAAQTSIIAKGFEKTGLQSHILFAACMQHQQAMESQERGVFTSELITLFKQEGVDKLTYQEVIATKLPNSKL